VPDTRDAGGGEERGWHISSPAGTLRREGVGGGGGGGGGAPPPLWLRQERGKERDKESGGEDAVVFFVCRWVGSGEIWRGIVDRWDGETIAVNTGPNDEFFFAYVACLSAERRVVKEVN